MMSGSTKAIAATTVISGVAIIINLGVITGLFLEIGLFQKNVLSDMQEFNTLADQTWTTIIVSTPAAAAREKRAARGSSCSCSAQPNTCPRGPVGPRGRPGFKGPDGVNGIPGPNAHGVAGLVKSASGKKACIKCAPGPRGSKGRNGQPGKRGANGAAGMPGRAGRNGLAGAQGPVGDAGLIGSDGAAGHRGQPGSNGVRGRGAAGEPGRIGGRGNLGRQGRKGAMGTPGTPGPMGPQGGAGHDGENGKDGQAGAVGPIGAPGKNGDYCMCPKKEAAVKTKQVVQDQRGYEVQDALEVQRLVESSAFKMEEPTSAPSSPASYEAAAPAEEVVDAAEVSTTVGHEQPAVEATTVTATTVGQSTSTAPPGFSPKSFAMKSSLAASEPQGHDAAASTATEKEQPVVQVTPIYHRATGGGRKTTPVPTTSVPLSPVSVTAATLSKFVRHAGGWSRRVAAPHPQPVPGSKTHDAELHVSRRAFGGARSL